MTPREKERLRGTARRRAAGIPPRGPSPRRKLTADQVIEIRTSPTDWKTVRALAARFGVAHMVVYQVIERWTYKEVQP